MRQLIRLHLPSACEEYLSTRTDDLCNPVQPPDIETHWKNSRRNKAMQPVLSALTRMAGETERCMYCEDSRGTDIEHFYPKKHFAELTYVWNNMLLVCSGCNRKKGDLFPIDSSGVPLLIDPTAEDPWQYIVFEPDTGLLVSRYSDEGTPDPKGKVTLEILSPLNDEPVTRGRSAAFRNLRRAVNDFLDLAGNKDINEAPEELTSQLREAICDVQNYGIAQWCFIKEGHSIKPFVVLMNSYPSTWQSIVDLLNSGT